MSNSDANRASYLAGAFQFLRARQIIVQDTPENAVQLGVSYLLAYGFRVRPGDITAALRAEGSPWTAEAVEIGEYSGALRGCLHSLISQTLLALVLKRTIPPTLVIVAARAMPDGSCALVIQPFAAGVSSESLLEDDSWGARNMTAPQVKAATTAVIDAYQGVGRLTDPGKPAAFVKDQDSRATVLHIRELTGW